MRLHCALKSGLWSIIPMAVFLTACDPVLHPELPDPAVANAADICIPPSMPSNLGLVVEADQIRLSWATEETALAGFVIERRLFLDPTWGELTRIDDPQQRVFVDLSADLLDAQYGYRLRAFQRVGDFACASPATEEKVATTFPKPPQEPHVQAFADRIELNWLDPNDFEMGYRIERRRQELDRDFLLVAELDRNVTRWIDVEPEAGHVYDYHIYAVNRSGESQVVSLSAPAILAARVPSAPILSWAGEPELDTQCGLHLAANAVFDDALGAVYDDENSHWLVEQGLSTSVQAPSEGEQSFALDAQLAPFSGSFSAQWDVVDSLGSQAQLERRMQMSSVRTSLVRDRLPTAAIGDDDGAGRQVLLPGCSDCQGERGSLAVGDHHACVLREGGRVQCWGNNRFGQLGNGYESWKRHLSTVCRGETGEPCASHLDAVSVLALGNKYSCARMETGEVKCWGSNGYMNLASGTDAEFFNVPTSSCLAGSQESGTCLPLDQVTDLTAGTGHACAVSSDGLVQCWGDNGDKLGLGELDSSLNPLRVCANQDGLGCSAQLQTVQKVVTGSNFVCALLDDSTLRCWGANNSGKTGVGNTDPVTLPAMVCATGTATENTCVQFSGVLDVQLGDTHACALLSGGRLACWGSGWDGQLGNGTDDSSSNPSMVCLRGSQSTGDCIPLQGVVSFSLGEDHTCAVVETGEAYCWGSYYNGRLGSGLTHDVLNPTPICIGGAWDGSSCAGELDTFTSLTGVRTIAAGADHSCAILDDTSVQCWGKNYNGALGDGTWEDRDHPVQVCTSGSTDGGDCVPLTGALELALGDELSCARMLDGGVKCWGLGDSGMLGDGGENSYTYYPVDVCASGTGASCVPLTGAASLSAWGKRACASLSGGELLCWGDNGGYLGDGTTTDQYNPVPVCLSGSSDQDCVAMTGVQSFAVGSYQACATDDTGALWCWGSNGSNQLGAIEGNGHNVPAPRAVCETGFGVDCQPLQSAIQVAAGDEHSCAIVVVEGENQVRCWGYGYYGALGQGDWESSAWPVGVCAQGSWDGERCSGAPLIGAVQLVSGDNYTCARMDDGSVYCWGSAYTAGDQSGYDTANPVQVCIGTYDDGMGCTPLNNVVQISGGEDHICAVLQSGGLKCWGLQNAGRLGDGTDENSYRDGAVDVCQTGHYTQGACTGDALQNVAAVSAGEKFTCALLTGGSVQCWGSNTWGQLGADNSEGWAIPQVVCQEGSLEAGDCEPLDQIVAIQAGFSHICAMREVDGQQSVLCWGDDSKGELGAGNGDLSPYPTDVCLSGNSSTCVPLTGAVQLAAGTVHTCALMQNGGVKCWGQNTLGQLGNGLDWQVLGASVQELYASSIPELYQANPVDVCAQGRLDDGSCQALTGVGAVFAEGFNSCALMTTGEARCWGDNHFGQVGNGVISFNSMQMVVPQSTPQKVCREGRVPYCEPLLSVANIEMGFGNSCAILQDGTMRCWGRDDYGQLGQGQPTFGRCLNANFDLNGFNGVSPGEVPCSALPVPVCRVGSGFSCDRLHNIQTASLGYWHSCASFADGTMSCWGRNLEGQFGAASDLNSYSPVPVSNAQEILQPLTGVAAHSAAGVFTCALNDNQSVRCWGSRDSGQLGLGEEPANGWDWCQGNAEEYAAGDCAWVPQPVCAGTKDSPCQEKLNQIIALDSGAHFSCALKNTGQVFCWGSNDFGQLGNGNSGDVYTNFAAPVCAYRENGLCVAPEPASVATCDLYSVTEVQ